MGKRPRRGCRGRRAPGRARTRDRLGTRAVDVGARPGAGQHLRDPVLLRRTSRWDRSCSAPLATRRPGRAGRSACRSRRCDIRRCPTATCSSITTTADTVQRRSTWSTRRSTNGGRNRRKTGPPGTRTSAATRSSRPGPRRCWCTRVASSGCPSRSTPGRVRTRGSSSWRLRETTGVEGSAVRWSARRSRGSPNGVSPHGGLATDSRTGALAMYEHLGFHGPIELDPMGEGPQLFSLRWPAWRATVDCRPSQASARGGVGRCRTRAGRSPTEHSRPVLELARFTPREVDEGSETGWVSGALHLSLDHLAAAASEAALSSVKVEVVHPGDPVRIANVLDAIVPAVKADDPSTTFPGVIGRLATAGGGRTNRLDGVRVLSCCDWEAAGRVEPRRVSAVLRRHGGACGRPDPLRGIDQRGRHVQRRTLTSTFGRRTGPCAARLSGSLAMSRRRRSARSRTSSR